MKCPNCGREIADDSNYCEYCGTKVRGAFNKKALLITLGVLAAVCIVWGVVKLVPKHQGEQIDEPAAATVEETKEEQIAPPSLSVSKKKIFAPSSGKTEKITVTCNMDWETENPSDSVFAITRSGNVLKVKIAANPSTESRTAYFSVRTTDGSIVQKISLSQKGKEPPVAESAATSGGVSEYQNKDKISHKDTVYIIKEGGQNEKTTNTMPDINMKAEKHFYYVVYFNNDSYALDDTSKLIIAEASQRMLQDNDLYALIVGYRDTIGEPKYNNWLAVKRSYNVGKEMSRENNVEMARMHTIGKGIITENNPKQDSYRINHRVEIHLLTHDEYERAKQLYQDLEKINRGDAMKQKKNKVTNNNVSITVPDDLNMADGSHIIVKKATTLKSLALTHYKNLNCWIYLYLANGEFISSPSYVAKGVTIILPQLNEQQLNITAEEAESLRQQYVTKN